MRLIVLDNIGMDKQNWTWKQNLEVMAKQRFGNMDWTNLEVSFNQCKKVIQTKIYILSKFILFSRVEQFVNDSYVIEKDAKWN